MQDFSDIFCLAGRMVFAVLLILLGYFVILPLSLGNNPTHRTPFRMVACSVLAALYSVYVHSCHSFVPCCRPFWIAHFVARSVASSQCLICCNNSVQEKFGGTI